MLRRRIRRNVTGRAGQLAAVALGICLAAGPALGAEGIDPDADKVLRAMSNYLGGLSAFTVNADIDNEFIDVSGQKIQLSSSGELVLNRPGSLYMHRQGAIADMEIIFDGKTVTLHGKKLKVYKQLESPGNIDDAFANLRADTGLDFPGQDLLYSDPYPGLVTDVMSGAHFGTAYVNGVECHHLAFRAARVDWQLWVRTGNKPLPMKYIITSKWVTGAPQYSARFRDWNTNPSIDAGRFAFTPPAGARELDTIPVSELGELIIEELQ